MSGLTIFDIDDTLFHTDARIRVLNGREVVHTLTPDQYNAYELKTGESFDFTEFLDSEIFQRTAKPIGTVLAKASAMLKNIMQKGGGSKMILLTARQSFNDKNPFLETFRQHGFNIDSVYVERAGDLLLDSNAIAKGIVIRKYLDTKRYSRCRLFDDSVANLEHFVTLGQEYPSISFEGYRVFPATGKIKKFYAPC